MSNLLLTMLLVMAAWGIMIPLTVGIGLLLPKPYRVAGLSIDSLITDFWLGLAIAIGIVQIWQLLLPANSEALVLLSTLGLIGILLRHRQIVTYVLKRRQKALWFSLFVGMLALLLANKALDELVVYDAGLYHLSMIEWLHSYRLVPGLGNLHGRFAFNNSSFLLFSILEPGLAGIRSYNLVDGALLLVTTMQISLSFWRIFTQQSSCRICDGLTVLFLAPIAFYAITNANSTSPDHTVFILGFVIGVQLCRLLFEVDSPDVDLQQVAVIVLLAAVGTTVKLSFIVLGSLSAITAIAVVLVRFHKRGQHLPFRYAAWIIMPALILLSTWAVRGYVLSGYPAYPSTIGGIETLWSVPRASAMREKIVTFAWARQRRVPPEVVLADRTWLRQWSIEKTHLAIALLEIDIVFPLLLAGMAAVLAISLRTLNKINRSALLLFVIPPLAATIFWFFTVPTTRFLGASLWLAAGIMLVTVLEATSLGKQNAVLLVVALLTGIAIGAPMSRGSFPVLSGPDNGLYPLPVVELTQYSTDSGLVLNVPAEGNQCWEAPLPCTPKPNPSLHLLNPESFNSGFSVSTE